MTLRWEVLFDFTYNFVVLILVQIIAGFITNTFASLRQEEKLKRDDMLNVCFICGFDREYYDKD